MCYKMNADVAANDKIYVPQKFFILWHMREMKFRGVVVMV